MKQVKMMVALSLMLIAFNSCQKNEIVASIDEISLSQTETQVEVVLSNIDLLVDEAININASQLKSASIESAVYLTDCPVITTNKTATPQVMTLDFGTACTGKDGKIRSGKIIVTATSFKTFPSTRSKSFDNFYVDGKKVEGSIVKTISKDQDNNNQIAELKENITVTFPAGEGTAQRVSNMTRQYLRTTLENKVVSWGTVEFTKAAGVKITKTIAAENPLVFNVACQHIVSGTVSFSNSKSVNWSINYGTGECDDIATMTRGDKTKEIKIR